MPRIDSFSDETLLIAGLKRGDELAYRYLFDNYYRKLVTFANRILIDADSSRNMVQDTFVNLYDKRDVITIHTNLKAHLFQTVRNRCLNLVKHEKMKKEHHSRIASSNDHFDLPSQHVETGEIEACIRATINDLPAQCQRIFKLSRDEGKSNQEIAEMLDLSKRTVETQISKALKRLRDELALKQLLTILVLVFINGLF